MSYGVQHLQSRMLTIRLSKELAMKIRSRNWCVLEQLSTAYICQNIYTCWRYADAFERSIISEAIYDLLARGTCK